MAIKVFLADDHAVVRDGLKSLLESEKDICVIGGAAGGRDTVSQVQKLKPDTVIMDIAMPELNGIEATQQILRTCPSTRVVILSMHSSKEHIFQALQAGALGYLLKESAGQEVVKAIHTVQTGARYLSPRITDMMIDDYIHQRQMAQSVSPFEQLSSREREILQLVVEGKSSSEIADILYISPKTVETYRSRIMQKLGIHDLPTLVKFAIRHGLTTLDT
jgi:DNA-binding NarL/FixJ family response regulator